MKAKYFALLTLCATLMGISGNGAENIGNSRFYLIGDVGANFVPKMTFNVVSGNPNSGFSSSVSPGVRATVGVGYNWLPQLAAEAEMGFSYNEAKVDIGLLGGQPAGANLRIWHVPLTVGVNWRPFIPPPPPPGENNIRYGQEFFQRLQPYLGGGLGVAEIFGEVEGFPSSTNPTKTTGTDTVLTFYVKAGLTYPVAPNVDLGVQYRFYGSPGFSIKETETDGYYAHAVSAVLRWKF